MENNVLLWLTSAEPSASEAFAPMPTKLLLEQPAPLLPGVYRPSEPTESLFEHVAWLYVFCREKLFRDDTDRIGHALWPDGNPAPGTKLIELGCGPGFYAARFAERYPQILVVGMDRSAQQLAWARARAARLALSNCTFDRVNVLAIPSPDSDCDALIASRLFTVLAERERALCEMHRVLKPGGRCLIAEPRHAFRASIPLVAMWLLARLTHFSEGYREPYKAFILSEGALARLCATQPWKKYHCWQDGRYQYALCEKA